MEVGGWNMVASVGLVGDRKERRKDERSMLRQERARSPVECLYFAELKPSRTAPLWTRLLEGLCLCLGLSSQWQTLLRLAPGIISAVFHATPSRSRYFYLSGFLMTVSCCFPYSVKGKASNPSILDWTYLETGLLWLS